MEKEKVEKKIKEAKGTIFKSMVVVFLMVLVVLGCYPMMKIWYREAEGQAQLKEAEWSRKIRIEEADAELIASEKLAAAEIIRARAAATAAGLIGEAMEKNEAYIRYLWVKSLSEPGNRVIYIPTEANLPILEAKSEGVVKVAEP